MKNVSVGDLEIAYVETGLADGPPVVLLHGFPYDVHAYDTVAEILVASGYRCIVPYLRGGGPTRFLSENARRSGEQAALGADLLALLNALSIETAVLGGYDWGGRAACIVSALWPERVRGLVSCGAGCNIQNITQAGNPAPPDEEARLWYQYYFHSDRGRAALEKNRRSVCEFIWKIWSPTWAFDGQTFDRTAASFDNPDFVEVVIHSYKHRFGGVPGDPALVGIESQLAEQPDIMVPTIVLLGADDGVTPPAPVDYDERHFKAAYERRIVHGAGHNLPQEAPKLSHQLFSNCRENLKTRDVIGLNIASPDCGIGHREHLRLLYWSDPPHPARHARRQPVRQQRPVRAEPGPHCSPYPRWVAINHWISLKPLQFPVPYQRTYSQPHIWRCAAAIPE
jgi:pimeloyl-ACP methyl ester carboxylesterase